MDTRLAWLEKAYEAWNRRDFEAWADCFEADAEFDPSGVFLDQDLVRGRDGLRRWGGYAMRAWDTMTLEPVEPHEVTDAQIRQRVQLRARGRTTGIEVDQTVLQVFDYAGGEKPVRLRMLQP